MKIKSVTTQLNQLTLNMLVNKVRMDISQERRPAICITKEDQKGTSQKSSPRHHSRNTSNMRKSNESNSFKDSHKNQVRVLSKDLHEDQVFGNKLNSKKPEDSIELKITKANHVNSVPRLSDRCLSLFEHAKCTDKKFYCYR